MKTLGNAFTALYQRNALLATVGMIHLVIGLLLLLYLPFETRQVMGINLWIKPIKFYLSGVIYLWTLAIFLSHLTTTHPKQVRFIAWVAALAMIVENVCISWQAARGNASHFNESSLYNSYVFTLMGVAIGLNTLVMAYLLWLYLRNSPPLPHSYLWGIRLGLLLFLFGSAVGGVMVTHRSHNVGVPMGGAGLPFTNWSTLGGDLRIAHFLGLHALQLIPLIGYLMSKMHRANASLRLSLVYTFGFAILYSVLVGMLYWQALNGVPLVNYQ